MICSVTNAKQAESVTHSEQYKQAKAEPLASDIATGYVGPRGAQHRDIQENPESANAMAAARASKNFDNNVTAPEQKGCEGDSANSVRPVGRSPAGHETSAPIQERQKRYQEAASLIEKWSKEPGDYDERVMALLEQGRLENVPEERHQNAVESVSAEVRRAFIQWKKTRGNRTPLEYFAAGFAAQAPTVSNSNNPGTLNGVNTNYSVQPKVTQAREWLLNVRADGEVRGAGRTNQTPRVPDVGNYYSDNEYVTVREVSPADTSLIKKIHKYAIDACNTIDYMDIKCEAPHCDPEANAPCPSCCLRQAIQNIEFITRERSRPDSQPKTDNSEKKE